MVWKIYPLAESFNITTRYGLPEFRRDKRPKLMGESSCTRKLCMDMLDDEGTSLQPEVTEGVSEGDQVMEDVTYNIKEEDNDYLVEEENVVEETEVDMADFNHNVTKDLEFMGASVSEGSVDDEHELQHNHIFLFLVSSINTLLCS
ncbi:hypothetical protein L2E82_12160 [Cichorium intybus]|uniref:Uncharacterized protein n=1 Tax=Cichorium intybus TaxID=13427 RepID=A0ACB9GHA8_CICIN|nr:hypothetical protein L2E82_12160 [Cichorium intybus]